MRKKSNKFQVCESCGRDAHGGTDPSWKPPAVSLKTQLEEASQALTTERSALLKEQADHRKTDEVWAGVLKDKRIQVQKLVAEHTEIVTRMERDLLYLKEQNKELTKRLDYETRRAAQALEVADNAAIGTACIARITNRLSCITDTLEVRIEQSNDALGKVLKTTRLKGFRDGQEKIDE